MTTVQRFLSTYPGAKVRIACRTCGASWQFDMTALLDRLGDVGLASSRTELTKAKGCTKGGTVAIYDLCGAYYVDLWTPPAGVSTHAGRHAHQRSQPFRFTNSWRRVSAR